MTQLPPQSFAQPGQVQATALPGLFPSEREEYRCYQKQTPSGLVVEFVYLHKTFVRNGTTFVTTKLIKAPTLACGCSPRSVADVMECSSCLALVCRSYHAATCQYTCGRVICSGCGGGIFIDDIPILACNACIEVLTAGPIKKAYMDTGSFLWGGA